MERSVRSYGPHLTMDMGNCDPVRLDDLDVCFNVLDTLPERIGMTKITQPYVFRYAADVPEDSGITGVVIIAESHISIHTYPAKRFAFADVFSCKPFDVERASRFIVDAFRSLSPVTHVEKRGKFFPHQVRLAS